MSGALDLRGLTYWSPNGVSSETRRFFVLEGVAPAEDKETADFIFLDSPRGYLTTKVAGDIGGSCIRGLQAPKNTVSTILWARLNVKPVVGAGWGFLTLNALAGAVWVKNAGKTDTIYAKEEQGPAVLVPDSSFYLRVPWSARLFLGYNRALQRHSSGRGDAPFLEGGICKKFNFAGTQYNLKKPPAERSPHTKTSAGGKSTWTGKQGEDYFKSILLELLEYNEVKKGM